MAGNTYFTFQQVGAYTKVVAVDEDTGEEVAIVAASSATEAHMKTIALNKLKQHLAKLTNDVPPWGKRGTVV